MPNISSLQHAHFLAAAQEGALAVTINRKLAAKVMQSSLIPADYKLAYKLWTLLWVTMVPAALAIGYLVSWWLAPPVLIGIFFGHEKTLGRSATNYVFDYARESELFYDIMVQLGIMTVGENAKFG